MSIPSDPKAAAAVAEVVDDDTCELEEHEFTLDPEPEDAVDTAGGERRSSSVPPPPPRRRPAAVEPDRGSPAVGRRSVSGIFALVPPPPPEPSREAVAQLKAELGRLQAQMLARDAYLRELERALDERTRQLAASGLGSLEDVARLFGRLRGYAFRVAELELELRRATAAPGEPARGLQRAELAPGDLRRIRGIGPRFAKQLAELGYATFGRIAEWTAEDIAHVAKRLRVTSERIAREGWIDQAKRLRQNSD